MDLPSMTPRMRMLLALGACAVLLTATIGSAAARADLRPASTDPGVTPIGVRDDEHEPDAAVADETDKPEVETPETPETAEPDEAADAKDADDAAKPKADKPKDASTSTAENDDQGEDSDEGRDDEGDKAESTSEHHATERHHDQPKERDEDQGGDEGGDD